MSDYDPAVPEVTPLEPGVSTPGVANELRSVLRVWQPLAAEDLRPGHKLIVDGTPFEVDEVRLNRAGVKVYGQATPFGADAVELPEPSRRRGLTFQGGEPVAVLASREKAAQMLSAMRELNSTAKLTVHGNNAARLRFWFDGWHVDATMDDTG